jgi:hypothetical protein
MRIGFCSVYSWRPHVEHLYFLALLAEKAGHEAYFLTCDGDLSDCYTRELRDRPAWRECLDCRLGGIRSYAARNVSAIGRYANGSPAVEVPVEWAHSSASTLGRFESDADYLSPEFAAIAARLYPAVQVSYAAARAWIAEQKLDAVCVFNGRMDATRAIFEAARSLRVTVVSVERAWFGNGLHLLPDENCLGLKAVDRLVAQWKDRPLTSQQALSAASHIAKRFLRTNVHEWRAYNTNARTVKWPVPEARRRVLLIPSSRNEVWGHPDWEPVWSDPTDAYDALIAHLKLAPTDVVLRCHPNWGEKIGKQGGAFSERHYTKWANDRSILCIPSHDRASTLGLIEQCDAIVVANGSSALEAGFLGKQVIGVAPSFYEAAGIRDPATNPVELGSLQLWAEMDEHARAQRAWNTARQTLRFCYTMIYRVAQYTRSVKAETTTSFRYDFDASPDRFIDLLRTGALRPDDEEFATDPAGEMEVLEQIRARDWKSLCNPPDRSPVDSYAPLKRRLSRRPIDWISKYKPVGDR